MIEEIIDYIRDKLKGKKTYTVVIVGVIIAILQATGVLPPELPKWLWTLLSALGLGGLRAGVKKTE